MAVKAVAIISGGPYKNLDSTSVFDMDVQLLHLASGVEHTLRLTEVETAFLTTTVLQAAIREAVRSYLIDTQMDTFGLFDTVMVLNATV